MQPVGAMYMAAVLLTNIHTCFNESQVSKAFDCAPPTLEDYLHYEDTLDISDTISAEENHAPSNAENHTLFDLENHALSTEINYEIE